DINPQVVDFCQTVGNFLELRVLRNRRTEQTDLVGMSRGFERRINYGINRSETKWSGQIAGQTKSTLLRTGSHHLHQISGTPSGIRREDASAGNVVGGGLERLTSNMLRCRR